MRFLTETAPDHTQAQPVASGIRRLVAANPGPMTYHGTNTYLLGWEDGVAVIDPGPDDAAHGGHILAQAGGPIRAILLTHGHHDHWGGLAALKRATGAPVYAWHHPFAAEVRPDVKFTDGAELGPLRAVHTPGHAPDHLCFVHADGVVFSGDVVMGWSTTVVGGQGGDMADYFATLDRLLGMPASLYLPGHGPPITEPLVYVESLRHHRRQREAAIVAALGAAPVSVATLTRAIYPSLEASLRPAAERNVLAHLDKLEAEGRAMPSDAGWRIAHQG
ncbi:MAG: MBL fold metallo-hydrolase [Acetobacteraceae bacterium]|nr:MBL fold metallo-hydrolase [Acetobacteraceae bacterium]